MTSLSLSPNLNPNANPQDVRAYHQQLSLHVLSLIGSSNAPLPKALLSTSPTQVTKRDSASTTSSQPSLIHQEEMSIESESNQPTPPEFTARPTKARIVYPRAAVGDGETTEGESDAAPESRDEEHKRAWRTDGCRVWKVMPPGFELKLDTPGFTKKRGSSSVGSGCQIGLGIQHLGLDDHLDEIPCVQAGESASEATPIARPASRLDSIPHSHISTNASPALDSTSISSHSIYPRPDRPLQPQQLPAAVPQPRLRLSKEEITYEERRKLRLLKKQVELSQRISTWYITVPNGSIEVPPPITPPIPSPTAVHPIRLSPFDMDFNSGGVFSLSASLAARRGASMPLNSKAVLRDRVNEEVRDKSAMRWGSRVEEDGGEGEGEGVLFGGCDVTPKKGRVAISEEMSTPRAIR